MDRDGTISEEIGYVNHPSRYKVFDFSGEAVSLLNNAGWLAVLVTNQAGVARGYFEEKMIGEVHNILESELESQGGKLDAIYYCAHHPSVGEPPYRFDCNCRKPKPGLIHRAAEELDIDIARSWMIGDRYSDVELARNAGMRSALVLTGYGRGEWEFQRHQWPVPPDIVANDLLDAVRAIISLDTANL
jgi:D-glycero-D-manno-heptose 1,7-bisphosphate phosphatase